VTSFATSNLEKTKKRSPKKAVGISKNV